MTETLLVAAAFDAPATRSLTAAMEAEMVLAYGGSEVSPAVPEDFSTPPGVFLLARLQGVDAGCGGLRLLRDGVGEVKRMYVAPSVRGRGVGRALLRGLLEHARDAGLTRVQLETGTAQPDAMALYEGEGFTPVPAYGHHRDDPRSRCYALDL